jgi:enoyl-CoA hydratase/carnithine racemase
MVQFPVALPSKEVHHMTLDQEGPLFILYLHNKDNRFTTEFCQSIIKALTIIEDIFFEAEDPVDMALVTVGQNRIYSNGLDLAHALVNPLFIDTFLFMLRRMLTFCIPTIAAINGHAFAGGCMLALAHGNRIFFIAEYRFSLLLFIRL